MKKSLLASASVTAIVLATGAQAADLGNRPVYKAPAFAPAPWSWTGFYVGGNVGAVWGRSSVENDPSSVATWLDGRTDNNRTGVIGGVQAGYNWQWASLVLGIEGDISFASLDRSVTAANFLAPPFQDTLRSRLDWLATIRGRLGWAVDRWLIYGTGGVAFAHFNDELSDPPSVLGFTVGPDSSRTGWTAGGGIEYAFTDHWTAKAEYLHVGFADQTATVTTPPAAGYAFRFRDSLDIARVGINYKF
ncbi:MAG TPA: outer membrane protein [Pseudolabrys sp.]|nr:outer membrane protein [Pseudolabrys sp.]